MWDVNALRLRFSRRPARGIRPGCPVLPAAKVRRQNRGERVHCLCTSATSHLLLVSGGTVLLRAVASNDTQSRGAIGRDSSRFRMLLRDEVDLLVV